MYSISTLLNDLTSVTHGTTVNKVPNIFGIINRSARAVLADVDPKETQRIGQLTSHIFNDVYDYACPTDLKGDRIVDLRLQAGRMPWDVFTQDYAQVFDANKLLSLSNKVYTQWNTGVKTLRIEAPLLTEPVTITSTGSTTGWGVTAGAQNLSLDTTYNVAGSGALQFDLAANAGGLGSELITNGNFTGNANGWTLGTNWAYAANSVTHSAGNTAALSQIVGTIDPAYAYQVTLTIGGTIGTVNVIFGVNGQQYAAGAGTVTLQTSNYSNTSGLFEVLPSVDFNGTIDSVSVKQVTGGTGTIQNSTITAIDLSSHVNISTLFAYVYLPSAASVTSVTLKWGSSASNYYILNTTGTQQGTVFQNGWNLLAFSWPSATKVGTPVNTTYQYVQALVNYDGTLQTGVKLDNLVSAIGSIFELQYYSKYIFRNPNTNAFQETVVDEATDGNTLINLDTDSYNLLFNKCAFYVAQSLQGADSDYDAAFWDSEYEVSLKRYRGLNPSEAMLKRTAYYSLPNKGYNRFGPFGPNRQ